MAFLYISLLLIFIRFGEFNSFSLRQGPISTKSHVQVFEVAADGGQKELSMDAISTVHDVLCSEKVISRLERCGSAAVPSTSQETNLYPMSEEYEAAVLSGHACPLPAPFMIVEANRCCVGSDVHVWPNFCPNAHLIGSHVDPSIWSVGGSVHVMNEGIENLHHEQVQVPKALHAHQVQNHQLVLGPGIFRIGRPDVPQSYSRWKLDFGVVLTYFVSGVIWVLLAVYIQGWLDDEAAILKGQNRERLLTEMRAQKDDFSSSSSSGVSSVASLSPAHAVMSEAGKVSMAFGLLPSNPRGRSAASSTLNTPRP